MINNRMNTAGILWLKTDSASENIKSASEKKNYIALVLQNGKNILTWLPIVDFTFFFKYIWVLFRNTDYCAIQLRRNKATWQYTIFYIINDILS